MKEKPLKHFVLAFLLALACYAIFYPAIEHRRNRQGPWEVTFNVSAEGMPGILIQQSKLAISNIQVTFPDQVLAQTNTSRTLFFEEPKPVPYDLPFGKCVFMDTTFLPGTVTFDMFGHEIELLPRALIVDRQDHPWLPDSNIQLHPATEPKMPKPAGR
jgi:hypothetical protein